MAILVLENKIKSYDNLIEDYQDLQTLYGKESETFACLEKKIENLKVLRGEITKAVECIKKCTKN